MCRGKKQARREKKVACGWQRSNLAKMMIDHINQTREQKRLSGQCCSSQWSPKAMDQRPAELEAKGYWEPSTQWVDETRQSNARDERVQSQGISMSELPSYHDVMKQS
ncbi:uncharacterized protein BP5553_10185 [Venustampulla echinocandica]|uniref:Uncharacterized protein n=1 Tax=Venustampulla echinocandica TaxID=2656787 RepID=A0A370TAM2_9HELO|nr:uncharacterized protein BP5553_10185 [Venustampulla echinocandica]RDL30840.1 hypothetical protein BP5553_10185 [Venustampulla echinocandica]